MMNIKRVSDKNVADYSEGLSPLFAEAIDFAHLIAISCWATQWVTKYGTRTSQIWQPRGN